MKLRRYVHVEREDDEGFVQNAALHLDFGDAWADLKRWIERKRKDDHDRAWDAFNARVGWWAEAMQRWDHWQYLEERARSHWTWARLSWDDAMDLEMYRAEADIRRDMRRQMFGEGVKVNVSGLAGLMGDNSIQNFLRLQQPRLIREMQSMLHKPNPLWKAITDGE